MASQVAESLAPVAVNPLTHNNDVQGNKTELARQEGIFVSVEGSDGYETERLQNGFFHQTIEKDGKEVLVSWTKEDESRVV